MNTVITNYGKAYLKPLHDRILVRRMEDTQQSLLVLPDVAKENSKIGEVIAAGPKAYGVQAGDIILLPGIAAKYPDWESCDMILVTIKDVGGVLDVSEA